VTDNSAIRATIMKCKCCEKNAQE